MLRISFAFIAFTILVSAKVQGQLCNNTILNCGLNLVNEQFSDFQIVSVHNISYAKATAKIGDVNYLSDCDESNDCNFDNAALTYDVYYPSRFAYTCYNTQPLPAIFLFRGSGFSDCYDSTETTQDYCMDFAKRGFVAFSVNYRTGRTKDPSGYLTASQMLAMYRSFQDARGAIRTAIYSNSFNTSYKIDTSNIFIGGISSGGEIALNIAYSRSESQNEEIYQGASDVLGPIDADYYKGTPDIQFSVKGVLNLWGAAFLPGSKSPAITLAANSFNPPLIAFHGLLDQTLWPTTTKVPLSTASPYNVESSCLLLDSNKKKQTYNIPSYMKALYQCGSSGLYDIFTNQLPTPVACELYLDSDMGHGLSFRSDFGFGDGRINNDDLKSYIIQRATTFFQAIVNKKIQYLKTTEFTDCVNYRIRACTKFDLLDKNACSVLTSNTSSTQNLISSKNDLTDFFTINQVAKKIYLHFTNSGNAAICLYDLNGQMVKKISSNLSESVINCDELSSGIYVLTVMQGTKIQRAKILLP
jgi:acetyl esterase/lipase